MLDRVLIADSDRDELDLLYMLAATAWPTAAIEETETDREMLAGTFPWDRYDLALLGYRMGFHRPEGPAWLRGVQGRPRPPITVVIGRQQSNWDALRVVKNGVDDCLIGNRLSARRLKTIVQRIIAATGCEIPRVPGVAAPRALRPRAEKGQAAWDAENGHLPASAFVMPGYQLVRQIASGAGAQVWLAKTIPDGAHLVLKIMPFIDDVEDDRLAWFMREYELVGEIEHPNVARIYERAFSSDFAYIAMELLSGGELTQVISDGPRVDVAKRCIRQVAHGLSAVHAHHVVHRDLKPSNILFRDDQTLAIIDFGTAKDTSAGAEAVEKLTVRGTPYYMSPEQIVGGDVDLRADLYSLGVIFFELLSGNRPFDAKKITDLLRAHMSNPIPRLPAAAACMQPLVDCLLAKDRDERYPSTQAFLADLDRHIPEP